MKKQTINLYLDFEFTSLSPDARPISLGIISSVFFDPKYKRFYSSTDKGVSVDHTQIVRFYAEFNDYDINMCDDWVKENVISKLCYNDFVGTSNCPFNGSRKISIKGDTSMVKSILKRFLDQFCDYDIQVVVDCGTWDWYHFLQLIAEWDELPGVLVVDSSCIPPDKTIEEFANEWRDAWENTPSMFYVEKIPANGVSMMYGRRVGLPKLPSNICPVPIDLNDIISMKMNISPREAFDICRETIGVGGTHEDHADEKHNSHWDAVVIKACYEKLMK